MRHPTLRPPEPVAIPDRDTWLAERSEALDRASARTVVAATTLAGEEPRLRIDLDKRRAIWICRRGRRPLRHGGRAGGARRAPGHRARRRCRPEGSGGRSSRAEVVNRQDVIERLAHTHLRRRPPPKRRRVVWRELWVAARSAITSSRATSICCIAVHGLVVDWKTDQVHDDAAVAAKVARYRLQGAAYAAAVEAATGEAVDRMCSSSSTMARRGRAPRSGGGHRRGEASTAELAEASAFRSGRRVRVRGAPARHRDHGVPLHPGHRYRDQRRPAPVPASTRRAAGFGELDQGSTTVVGVVDPHDETRSSSRRIVLVVPPVVAPATTTVHRPIAGMARRRSAR